jgi:hypothetical protein
VVDLRERRYKSYELVAKALIFVNVNFAFLHSHAEHRCHCRELILLFELTISLTRPFLFLGVKKQRAGKKSLPFVLEP